MLGPFLILPIKFNKQSWTSLCLRHSRWGRLLRNLSRGMTWPSTLLALEYDPSLLPPWPSACFLPCLGFPLVLLPSWGLLAIGSNVPSVKPDYYRYYSTPRQAPSATYYRSSTPRKASSACQSIAATKGYHWSVWPHDDPLLTNWECPTTRPVA